MTAFLSNGEPFYGVRVLLTKNRWRLRARRRVFGFRAVKADLARVVRRKPRKRTVSITLGN